MQTKFLSFKAICLIAMYFIGVSVQAQTYYVAPGGQDGAGRGTSQNPWKTLTYAINNVTAGSTILARPGVYKEYVIARKSGQPGNPITLKSETPGNPAIVDGTGLASGKDYDALLDFRNVSYITVDGLELRNLIFKGKNKIPCGVYISNNKNVASPAGNITIQNCRIHDIKTQNDPASPSKNRNAFGIAVYGRENDPILNVKVLNNEIYATQTGQSETIVFNGNVQNFVCNYNNIHDVNNIGIDAIGYEDTNEQDPSGPNDRAKNGEIKYNVVRNITSNNNDTYPRNDYSADGLYVDGATGILFEGNQVSNCDIGIELASEHSGKNTDNCIVRNNFVTGSRQGGIQLGGYDPQRGRAVNNKIYNNTLVRNGTLGWDTGEIFFQHRCNDNEVKNNILVASSSNWLIGYAGTGTTAGSGNTIGNNIYFSNGGANNSVWRWQGKNYTSFTQWKNQVEQSGTNSLFTNPQLQADNIHLQASSPAINAGIALSSALVGNQDIDLQPRTQGPRLDIGCDETSNTAARTIDGTPEAASELIQTFPNPTTDRLLIQSKVGILQLTVFDMQGKKLLGHTLATPQQNSELNLSTLPSGTYVLQVQTQEGMISRKIVR